MDHKRLRRKCDPHKIRPRPAIKAAPSAHLACIVLVIYTKLHAIRQLLVAAAAVSAAEQNAYVVSFDEDGDSKIAWLA